MKFKAIFFIPLLLGIGCSSTDSNLVVVCGWEEVFIADISNDVPEKTWVWTAEKSENLPSYMRNKYLTTDGCKPVNRSSQLLITSSGGGVALVNRSDYSAAFYASIPNAHSADLVGENRVAVAASYSSEGNRINLYDLSQSDIVIASDSLFGGHGVLYDKKSGAVWALGDYELRRYSLDDLLSISPKFTVNGLYFLPDSGGHDLSFNEKKGLLTVTTTNSVWLFDPSGEIFTKHPLLGDLGDIKSYSVNQRDKRVAYVKATEGNWWAYYIRFTESDRVVYLPQEKIYKVRWLN